MTKHPDWSRSVRDGQWWGHTPSPLYVMRQNRKKDWHQNEKTEFLTLHDHFTNGRASRHTLGLSCAVKVRSSSCCFARGATISLNLKGGRTHFGMMKKSFLAHLLRKFTTIRFSAKPTLSIKLLSSLNYVLPGFAPAIEPLLFWIKGTNPRTQFSVIPTALGRYLRINISGFGPAADSLLFRQKWAKPMTPRLAI